MKEKIVQRFKQMGWKKLSVLGAFCLVLCSGVGYAVWVLTAGDSFDAVVYSDGSAVLTISQYFNDVGLNTTLGADSKSTLLNISNQNGNLTMMPTINISKYDNTDSCTNYTGDCSVVFELNGNTVTSGNNITMPSGNSVVNATVQCVAFSCPQNITASVQFVG